MCNVFRAASIWIKIALIFFAVGLLLFVIGFATASWMVSYYFSSGLWQYYTCNDVRYQQQDCRTSPIAHPNSYHQAIQAMECLGLIGYFLALLFLFLYVFANSCRRRDILQAVTVLAIAGVIFAVIGIAIFGSSTNRENYWGYLRAIGWSMGIAIAGTVLYGLGAIMLIVQLVR